MKKLAGLLLLLISVTSCDSSSPEEKISRLNGYWEISIAEMPDGSRKEFSFNELVDFIFVENNKGFRKKVRPQLGGTFITSGNEELLEVKIEGDSINFYYSTPFSSWKETLLSSKEEEIIIKNNHGIIYTYKRFTPYSSDYGEEKE